MEQILLIDDDLSFLETLQLILKDDYKTLSANCAEKGLNIFKKEKIDAIITDLKMPEIDGIELLKKIKLIDDHIPVILVTAFDDMNSTIVAMQAGAYDYVMKPIDPEKIKVVVKRALESKKLSEKIDVSISKGKEEYNISNIVIGRTSQMNEIFKKIGQVSMNKVNVLVQGESGTGKELISRVIHYSGITKDDPFIAVNCSALSETLLESEMFGHVQGAFTGAVKEKKGKFELAGDGTIFLDEISEMSIDLQAKLLRVIQQREFEKVGGEKTIPMNARIIAATNKNLEDLVQREYFREDLYFRLKVFTITIPPLRERRDDIPNLVVYFLSKINNELHKNIRKVPFEVMEMLINHDWVGNVRELENCLYQAVVLSKSDVLEKENILLSKNNNKSPEDIFDQFDDISLEELEEKYIKYVLKKVKNDKRKACEILEISRPTLYRKLEKNK